jgi:hypothetical protein
MMFKFYHPQKGANQVFDKWKQPEESNPVVSITTANEMVIVWDKWITALDLETANQLARDIFRAIDNLGDKVPVSTPDDPALTLARRIASISAETGLKPGMVGRIIQSLKWDEEQKKLAAPAPQENHAETPS